MASVAEINLARANNVARGISPYAGAGNTGQNLGTPTASNLETNPNRVYEGQAGSGAVTASGQITNNGLTSSGNVNNADIPKSITGQSLIAQNPVVLPTQSSYQTNPASYYNNAVASGVSGLTYNPKTGTFTQPPTTEAQINQNRLDLNTQLYNLIGAPPSVETAYKQAQNESDILAKRQAVNDQTNKLNAISNQSQTDQLNLRSQGAREGVTEAVYSSQSAEIARRAAIEAFPVQASLAAAQGNLQLAQSNLDTLFKLKSEDLTNAYNYKKDLYKAVYTIADDAQKRQLTKLDLAETRAYETQKTFESYKHADGMEAFKEGNKGLFSSIMGAKNNEELATAVSKNAVQNLKAPTVTKINGQDYQWDSVNSKWVSPSLGTEVGTQGGLKQIQAQSSIQEITDLSKAPKSTAVGTSLWTRNSQGFWETAVKGVTTLGIGLIPDAFQGFSGARSNFIAGVEQLRSNLNLDTLIKAKQNGATFGALSDNELKVLASAATKIGTWAVKDGANNILYYNTIEDNFNKELYKINNFAKLDYLMKGGSPEDINVQILSDGSYITVNSDGTVTKLK